MKNNKRSLDSIKSKIKKFDKYISEKSNSKIELVDELNFSGMTIGLDLTKNLAKKIEL